MNKTINKNVVGIVFFAILMLLFTFLDLPVAKMIYAPASAFGRFFEIIGTLPLLFVGIFCTISLVMTTERKLSFKSAISYILGIMLYTTYTMYGIGCIEHQVADAKTLITVVAVIWTVICVFLVYRIMKNGNRVSLRRAAIIGAVGCLMSTIIVGQVKELFARQRFYTFANPDAEFTYWFQIQKATEVISEINDSFPSGHAAQAATSLFLVLVSGFVNVEDKCRFTKICAVIAGAFTICVMLSRMVLGMHFATDVIGGAALTLISMKLTQMVLDKINPSQK